MRQADIHPSALLGKAVTIGNFVTIQADVVIGDGTYIGPHATIMSGSRIGKNCQIFPGAVIGASAQERKATNLSTYVEVGDHTVIREFVTLNRGAFGNTLIGSHVLLMAYVHVAHDCIIGDHVIVTNAAQLAGHVQLHHHAVIGGMAAVHQFMRVGAYSMVASKSIVRKDVPPFIKVAREPLRYYGINLVALQRNGFTKEQCNNIYYTYRLIYHSQLLLPLALEEVDKQVGHTQEKEMILSFIRNSHKGIVKKTNT
ncbi:acyl-ACP--UDP-N-acetylglucosamine O-acyltransferase [Cardinium endosymbiont of Oedothorax gibbosus]|uniref:acyl-ACP--UDP-N-acetylglucosamine O-acyltransferase n=1 Tax=Cardinium endosymbiont of Oedothorax gibbosus TaxID=931101 RepID=UPI002023EC58|nr:acyl-ACP--UDP-N-acetylglucosamine O-acyltransferase [Cardinium endosymbiont of Oedothorax gibbosus]CAH2559751.1 Acyl-[acyl-carrier-protein]--UDP-N-acetylglucosamineO-acyltransferase [Cardinium endosymbiont of Oedothorax gibbosus]